MKRFNFFTQKKTSLILGGLLVLFYSCQKVVMIDVNNANQQVVVQGNITNQPGPYTVNLNYTTAYYNGNVFPPITGAGVQIYDNAGNAETLKETSQGIYKTDSLKGTPGRNYTLQVTANSTVYTAVSVMASPVLLDSVTVTPSINNKTNAISGNRIRCYFKDPTGLGNFYRVVINSNDTAVVAPDTYRILSDKLTDGTQMSVSFRTTLVSKDTVKVQLQCIDKNTYDFYNTIGGAKGSAGVNQFLGALPANPTNNISNKGLGYFAAYSVTTHTLIVP